MKILYSLLTLLLSVSYLFAQPKYEPDVVLLKVSDPAAVSIKGESVIGGSSQFISALEGFKLKDSKKLMNAGPIAEGWYKLEFPESSNVEVIKDALLNLPGVVNTTLNYYGILSSGPDDPYWTGGIQWSLALMEVDKAWDLTLPDNDILVGIMDTGIYFYSLRAGDFVQTKKMVLLK